MYYGLAALLALAGFVVANALLSLATAVVVGPLLRAVRPGGSPRRVRLLLALRLLPAAASAVFALGLLLPSYVLFEPNAAGEVPGLPLVALAVAALAVVVAGLRRGVASWRATRRLERTWSATAEPIVVEGTGLPTFRIRDPFPVVSLVGTWRPRLYVASQVVDALTPAELRAAAAHEAGHSRALDNLKRLLLRVAPDVLSFLPAARRLEREWARASELAADALAATQSPSIALDLGAALVKVAGLTTGEGPTAVAVSGLHGGSDLGLRVRRLLIAAEAGACDAIAPRRAGAWVAAGVALALLLARAPELLAATHRLTEATVRWLI